VLVAHLVVLTRSSTAGGSPSSISGADTLPFFHLQCRAIRFPPNHPLFKGIPIKWTVATPLQLSPSPILQSIGCYGGESLSKTPLCLHQYIGITASPNPSHHDETRWPKPDAPNTSSWHAWKWIPCGRIMVIWWLAIGTRIEEPDCFIKTLGFRIYLLIFIDNRIQYWACIILDRGPSHHPPLLLNLHFTFVDIFSSSWSRSVARMSAVQIGSYPAPLQFISMLGISQKSQPLTNACGWIITKCYSSITITLIQVSSSCHHPPLTSPPPSSSTLFRTFERSYV